MVVQTNLPNLTIKLGGSDLLLEGVIIGTCDMTLNHTVNDRVRPNLFVTHPTVIDDKLVVNHKGRKALSNL